MGISSSTDDDITLAPDEKTIQQLMQVTQNSGDTKLGSITSATTAGRHSAKGVLSKMKNVDLFKHIDFHHVDKGPNILGDDKLLRYCKVALNPPQESIAEIVNSLYLVKLPVANRENPDEEEDSKDSLTNWVASIFAGGDNQQQQQQQSQSPTSSPKTNNKRSKAVAKEMAENFLSSGAASAKNDDDNHDKEDDASPDTDGDEVIIRKSDENLSQEDREARRKLNEPFHYIFYNDSTCLRFRIEYHFPPKHGAIRATQGVAILPNSIRGWSTVVITLDPGETARFTGAPKDCRDLSLEHNFRVMNVTDGYNRLQARLSEMNIQRLFDAGSARAQQLEDYMSYEMRIGAPYERQSIVTMHLLNYCTDTKTLKFVDPIFRPNSSSLGCGKLLPWRRPHEMAPRHPRPEIALKKNIKNTALVPGIGRDSWLLSAISALTDSPTRVRSMFVNTPEMADVGAYIVRINKDGWWHNVIIDDFLPCLAFKPAYANTHKENCCEILDLWVALVQKAYAKLSGGYAKLEHPAGDHLQALQDLTGYPVMGFEGLWDIINWRQIFATQLELKEAARQKWRAQRAKEELRVRALLAQENAAKKREVKDRIEKEEEDDEGLFGPKARREAQERKKKLIAEQQAREREMKRNKPGSHKNQKQQQQQSSSSASVNNQKTDSTTKSPQTSPSLAATAAGPGALPFAAASSHVNYSADPSQAHMRDRTSTQMFDDEGITLEVVDVGGGPSSTDSKAQHEDLLNQTVTSAASPSERFSVMDSDARARTGSHSPSQQSAANLSAVAGHSQASLLPPGAPPSSVADAHRDPRNSEAQPVIEQQQQQITNAPATDQPQQEHQKNHHHHHQKQQNSHKEHFDARTIQQNEIDAQVADHRLFDMIRTHVNSYQRIVTVTTPCPDEPVLWNAFNVKHSAAFEAVYGNMGLVCSRAYAVLRVVENHRDKIKLLQIRDPWLIKSVATGDTTSGADAAAMEKHAVETAGSKKVVTWMGDWGMTSLMWSKYTDVAYECGMDELVMDIDVDYDVCLRPPNPSKYDGTFWMSWDDVKKYFFGGGVCFAPRPENRVVSQKAFDYRVRGDFDVYPKKGRQTVDKFQEHADQHRAAEDLEENRWNCPNTMLEIENHTDHEIHLLVTLSQIDRRGLPRDHEFHGEEFSGLCLARGIVGDTQLRPKRKQRNDDWDAVDQDDISYIKGQGESTADIETMTTVSSSAGGPSPTKSAGTAAESSSSSQQQQQQAGITLGQQPTTNLLQQVNNNSISTTNVSSTNNPYAQTSSTYGHHPDGTSSTLYPADSDSSRNAGGAGTRGLFGRIKDKMQGATLDPRKYTQGRVCALIGASGETIGEGLVPRFEFIRDREISIEIVIEADPAQRREAVRAGKAKPRTHVILPRCDSMASGSIPFVIGLIASEPCTPETFTVRMVRPHPAMRVFYNDLQRFWYDVVETDAPFQVPPERAREQLERLDPEAAATKLATTTWRIGKTVDETAYGRVCDASRVQAQMRAVVLAERKKREAESAALEASGE